MTRKQTLISVAVAVLLAAAGAGAWFAFGDRDSSSSSSGDTQTAAAKPSGPLPTPVVIVIDRAVILQASKAGQDIGRQVQEYAQQARAELDPQGRALQAEGQSLKAQVQSMTPEQRAQRVNAFEAKQAAFQQAAARKQNRIKAGLAAAQHQMEVKLEPILKQVMAEHGANLVLDKQAIAFAVDPQFDVSREAVSKLDAVLPSVKVDLPPESAVSAQ